MPGANTTPIAVAVIHSEELVREGAHAVLAREAGFAVVFTGAQLDALAVGILDGQVAVPQVVVLQWALPLAPLEAAVARWRKQQPKVPVVVVGELGVRLVQRAVEAGVHGVLPCNVTRTELYQALRTVAGGGLHGNEAMRHQLRRGMRGASGSKSDAMPALTPREAEVLRWMDHPDALSYAQIAAKLGVDLRTVESHRDNIFRKFGEKKRQAVLRKAARLGLL